MRSNRILRILLPALGVILLALIAFFAIQSQQQHQQAKNLAGKELITSYMLGGSAGILPGGNSDPGKPTTRTEKVGGISYTVKSTTASSKRTVSVRSSADGYTYTLTAGRAQESCFNLLCHFSN